MNVNNIYRKWEGKLSRDYINDIYQKFEFIGNKLFEDRNLEDVLNTFFHYETLIREKHNHIQSIESEMKILNRKKGDLLKKINGNSAYRFSLRELLAKFQSSNGKKIRLSVERNNKQLNFEFRLKKRI